MPNLIMLLLLLICSFGTLAAGLLKLTRPTFCERVADAFERLMEYSKDHVLLLIERFKDHVTANVESDLAYSSSILTAILALSVGHSYTASFGAGVVIAAAWFFRQYHHRWAFMPYVPFAVVSLLVWAAGVCSASGHSGFCIVTMIVLWLVCSVYNFLITPATNKLSPWLTGFLGPLHWALVLPAALGVLQSAKLTRQSYLVLTDWRRRGMRALGK